MNEDGLITLPEGYSNPVPQHMTEQIPEEYGSTVTDLNIGVFFCGI